MFNKHSRSRYAVASQHSSIAVFFLASSGVADWAEVLPVHLCPEWAFIAKQLLLCS